MFFKIRKSIEIFTRNHLKKIIKRSSFVKGSFKFMEDKKLKVLIKREGERNNKNVCKFH